MSNLGLLISLHVTYTKRQKLVGQKSWSNVLSIFLTTFLALFLVISTGSRYETRGYQERRKCGPVFWGYFWFIADALLQWSSTAASARNRGYEWFQRGEVQLIPSVANKVLGNWSLYSFIHFFALAKDKSLAVIFMNKIWMIIFVSRCHFTIAKAL